MMAIRNAILQLLVLIGFATCLVSCSPSEDIPTELKDLSILTGLPCEAPCWQNLILDKSSKQEVLDTLANLSFIDPANIRSQDAYWWGATPNEFVPATLILASCRQPSTKICVQITVVEDMMKSISLFPNYRLTFDEIVSQLGNPDYISTDAFGPECIGCVLEFIWSQSPIEISVTHIDQRCATGIKVCDAIQDGGKIPHDLRVEEITYQGSIPSYLETRMQDYYMPWPGLVEQ